MQAIVSVVVPIGAVDDQVSRQLGLVAGQPLEAPFEVLVSLNSTVPDDRARLESIVAELTGPAVRIVDSSGRRGAAHARNVAARASSAPLLAFCDADDRVHDGWLGALVQALDCSDAVTGRVVDVFDSPRTASWYPPATPDGLPDFLGKPYLLSGNLGIRREAFERVGGFDESLTRCEDIAIAWSLADAGYRLGYAPDAVIDYHHRDGLWEMLRRHYLYGRGMSEVLRRFGPPDANGRSPVSMLRPNGQPVARRTLGGFARRGAIAAGRLRGLTGGTGHIRGVEVVG